MTSPINIQSSSSAATAAPALVRSENQQKKTPLFDNRVFREVDDTGIFPKVLGELITEYASPQAFGPKEWHEYLGVLIPENVPSLGTHRFVTWWNGPDPLEPNQRVCDTHLAPIYRPSKIKKVDEEMEQLLDIPLNTPQDFPFTLHRLDKIVQKVRKGNPCSPILVLRAKTGHLPILQEGFRDKTPERGEWLVMRKKGVGRNQPSHDQLLEIVKKCPDCTCPNALDLATVTLIHYVVTGERYLATASGMEGRNTLSRCAETGGTHRDEELEETHLLIGEFSETAPCRLILKLPERKKTLWEHAFWPRAGSYEPSSPDVVMSIVHKFAD